jgi:hypothetical protein
MLVILLFLFHFKWVLGLIFMIFAVFHLYLRFRELTVNRVPLISYAFSTDELKNCKTIFNELEKSKLSFLVSSKKIILTRDFIHVSYFKRYRRTYKATDFFRFDSCKLEDGFLILTYRFDVLPKQIYIPVPDSQLKFIQEELKL